MITTKMYKYIGYNGTITSPILLPNIEKLEMVELRAGNGKILKNGDKMVYSAIVLPEDVEKWVEIIDQDMTE